MQGLFLYLKDNWGFFIPGGVILIAGFVIFFWLFKLQRRCIEMSERIAKLEGHVEGFEKDKGE